MPRVPKLQAEGIAAAVRVSPRRTNLGDSNVLICGAKSEKTQLSLLGYVEPSRELIVDQLVELVGTRTRHGVVADTEG
jgi:hypothetical protein